MDWWIDDSGLICLSYWVRVQTKLTDFIIQEEHSWETADVSLGTPTVWSTYFALFVFGVRERERDAVWTKDPWHCFSLQKLHDWLLVASDIFFESLWLLFYSPPFPSICLTLSIPYPPPYHLPPFSGAGRSSVRPAHAAEPNAPVLRSTALGT